MRIIIVVSFILIVFSACAPRQWVLMNTSGIFTYDRKTGKVELLWESTAPSQHSDTLEQSESIR